MNKGKSEINLNELLDQVDFGSMFEEKVGRKQINLLLRESYQRDFLKHQKNTRHQFGRAVIAVVEAMVDKANAADPYADQTEQSA